MKIRQRRFASLRGMNLNISEIKLSLSKGRNFVPGDFAKATGHSKSNSGMQPGVSEQGSEGGNMRNINRLLATAASLVLASAISAPSFAQAAPADEDAAAG
ncbi:MAG: hypothetical protein ACKOPM_06900, partial [Novosphingobium sp.]